ncbi:MAG: DUF4928 family protein, partial [Verrucomicrobia bacterium]|nr:DUF4928 family protein [Verrucomicrobiota bacterium]
WQKAGGVELVKAEVWWIDRVREHFSSEGPKFHFDPSKSLQANIEDLFDQAQELQTHSGGTNYVGAMLQHLVGAKLDLVLGPGKIEHHGFAVADRSTERQGDFHVDAVVIHVTTHPSEALIRKCNDNLQSSAKPVIVTVGDGIEVAALRLRDADLVGRIDVLDAAQFLTANVYERSLFQVAECKLTLAKLLGRYNEIVNSCETDPALQISIKAVSK